MPQIKRVGHQRQPVKPCVEVNVVWVHVTVCTPQWPNINVFAGGADCARDGDGGYQMPRSCVHV